MEQHFYVSQWISAFSPLTILSLGVTILLLGFYNMDKVNV